MPHGINRRISLLSTIALMPEGIATMTIDAVSRFRAGSNTRCCRQRDSWGSDLGELANIPISYLSRISAFRVSRDTIAGDVRLNLDRFCARKDYVIVVLSIFSPFLLASIPAGENYTIDFPAKCSLWKINSFCKQVVL
jgi:hypothetical protein